MSEKPTPDPDYGFFDPMEGGDASCCEDGCRCAHGEYCELHACTPQRLDPENTWFCGDEGCRGHGKSTWR